MNDSIKSLIDSRGSLSFVENLNFKTERVYWLHDLNTQCSRGHHAHKITNQILICISGGCNFHNEDLDRRKSLIEVTQNSKPILIKKLDWHFLDNFLEGTILLFLADQLYDASDYIRDYKKWKKIKIK